MQIPYNNSFEACQLNFWPLRHKVDNTKPYCQNVNRLATQSPIERNSIQQQKDLIAKIALSFYIFYF